MSQEKHDDDVVATRVSEDMTPERKFNQQPGLIYVAFGYEYLLMAMQSAFTAKQHNPGIMCSVVTDLQLGETRCLNKYFDSVRMLDMAHEQNRDIKTRSIEYAECERGAYIDCDTEVCGDLGPMFACLDRFDIILKLNPRPTNKDYNVGTGVPGYLFPFYNGGLVFFRNNDRARRFFTAWRKLYYDFGKKSDQPALAKAVYENPDVRYLTVGAVWNTFPEDVPLLRHKGFAVTPRIWHYIDPVDFPDVARRVYSHSQDILSSVCGMNAEQDAEVEQVGRKYRVLTAWYYRNRIGRFIFTEGLKLLHVCGVACSLQLKRRRYRDGVAFGKVASRQDAVHSFTSRSFARRLFTAIKMRARMTLIKFPGGSKLLARFVVSEDLARLNLPEYFWVTPDDIRGDVLTRNYSRPYFWFVQAGRWNDQPQSIKDSTVYKLFEKIVEVGLEGFVRSAGFQRLVEKAQSPSGFRTNRGVLRTEDAVLNYLESQWSLFDAMRSPTFFEDNEHAIPVAVGEDGSLYRRGDGKHRHVFAVLADFPLVKVRVVNLHRKYVALVPERRLYDSGCHLIVKSLDTLRCRYSQMP
jgi:hypothetical protein